MVKRLSIRREKSIKRVGRESPLASIEEQMDLLKRGSRIMGIDLSPEEEKLFRIYLEEILNYNRRFNLISKGDEGRIVTHHFLDSLGALPFFPLHLEMKVLDLGSGAGFPGIPLKICRREMNLYLVESIRKKSLFLTHLVQSLKLENAQVLNERAENLSERIEHYQKYDFVLARAVAKLKELVELSFPFLKSGGALISFKGLDVEGEIAAAAQIMKKIGGEIEERSEFELPFVGRKRITLSVRKI